MSIKVMQGIKSRLTAGILYACSISLKSVIDLGNSSTSLYSTRFGKSGKKRGGGKRGCGCAGSSFSHFDEGKEAKEL